MKLRTVLGATAGYSSMTILFPDSISIVTIGRGTSFPAASGSLLPCACTRPYCVCQIAAKSAPATSITTNREMRRTRDRLLDHVAHAAPWGHLPLVRERWEFPLWRIGEPPLSQTGKKGALGHVRRKAEELQLAMVHRRTDKRLSKDLDENCRLLESVIGDTPDLIRRRLRLGSRGSVEAEVIALAGLSDSAFVSEHVILPILARTADAPVTQI